MFSRPVLLERSSARVFRRRDYFFIDRGLLFKAGCIFCSMNWSLVILRLLKYFIFYRCYFSPKTLLSVIVDICFYFSTRMCRLFKTVLLSYLNLYLISLVVYYDVLVVILLSPSRFSFVKTYSIMCLVFF